MKFSIVIPNYNRYDLVHQLLYDIYQKCMPVHEVIVVNDGCTEKESFTGLGWWINQKLLPVREIRLEENVGFLKASNQGMKSAQGDVVCLISNDVRIRGDIVVRTEQILRNNIALVGGRYLDWDTGWNTFNGRIFSYIEGWLLATTKDVWERVGYFDEQFAPHDMEDVDLSTKIRDIGGTLVALPDDLTFHHGGQSIGFNAEREAITKRNRERFQQKWAR